MNPNGTTHPTGSGPSCPACLAAQTNPYLGETRSGCFDCQVRSLSNQPHEARAKFYATLSSDERRAEFQAAVSAEYRRRKALIADRALQ